MTATILDTNTGERWEVSAPAQAWVDGNYSCDCNRGPHPDTGYCAGARRYLVVAAAFLPDEQPWALEELNEEYPVELRRRFLPCPTASSR